MDSKAKIRVRNELDLKSKISLIHDSNGKSHRQLADKHNIGRSQVGSILKNKRTFLEAFENNEPVGRKRQATGLALDEVGALSIGFDHDRAR